MFLHDKGYLRTVLTRDGTAAQIRQIPTNMSLPQNDGGGVCELCILTKAKCLIKGKWLFLPIAAVPATLVDKAFLHSCEEALRSLRPPGRTPCPCAAQGFTVWLFGCGGGSPRRPSKDNGKEYGI